MEARALLPLALGALALGSCAKSPRNGSTSDFARLSFYFRMAEAVDPRYVYVVALRPLTLAEYQTSDGPGPAPLSTYNENGLVTGRPTLIVEYTPGQVQGDYGVYRFEHPPSDPSDPDPGRPTLVGEVISGSGLDPTKDGDPNSLGFDITTQDLEDDAHPSGQIVGMEFNILTMNQPAYQNSDVGRRVFDALGDQGAPSSYSSPRRIRVDTSQKYDNTGADGGQPASIPEPANDVVPNDLPPIDIIDYYVDVKTP